MLITESFHSHPAKKYKEQQLNLRHHPVLTRPSINQGK